MIKINRINFLLSIFLFYLNFSVLSQSNWTKIYETTNPSRHSTTNGEIIYTSGFGKTGGAASSFSGSYDRVKIRMENNISGTLRWAEVAFDTWSGITLQSLLIPDYGNTITTQRNVSNIEVNSNMPGVNTGNFSLGRLEFWRENYSSNVSGLLPAGSGSTYDWDDIPSPTTNGHGCFQVHNVTSGYQQTILAWNMHRFGGPPEIGFGSSSTGNPDWTGITANGSTNFKVQIFVGSKIISTQPSSNDQNLCINGTSTVLTTSALGTSVTYQWYKNTSNSNVGGTIISGATANTYTPPTNIAGTSYYYVVVSSSLGTSTSNVSGAVIVSPLSVGGVVSNNQTICSGTQPAALSLSSSIGTIQWQVSTDNINFSSISGANSTTLTGLQMGNLTATSYYRAFVTSGSCSADFSSVSVVNITQLPSLSSTTPATICGTGTGVLSASTGAGVINWYASASGGSSLNSTSSFTTPSVSTTTTYYVDVTNNGCTSGRTPVILTVNSLPSVATNSPSQIEYLVVGGGGGGGNDGAGGGGGGQVKTGTMTLVSGTYSVTIGAGGATVATTGTTASAGGTTTLSTPTVISSIGGAGGGSKQSNGGSGANGGGAGHNANVIKTGGTSTVGGYSGGNNGPTTATSGSGGGGGGGAAGAGQVGPAGNGGAGVASSISGSLAYYGGGGGGGSHDGNGTGVGGIGGGGTGGRASSTQMATAGTPNTGGGGGGSGGVPNNPGKAGGSGIVIIRYVGTPIATGGTITQVGGYTVHTFTTSGSFFFPGSASGASVPNQVSCGSSAVTFTGTVNAGLTLDWYDAASGGNQLVSGSTSYTTPAISTTSTYYVAVRNTSTGCISASRLAVTATINSASTITTDQSICPGSTPASINLSSASGTIQWESSTDNSSFTTISGQTGNSLSAASIGALYSTRYYRAVITNGSCVGYSPVHIITVTSPIPNAIPAVNDFVWNGLVSSDWSNSSNWLLYNGSNFQTTSSVPIQSSTVYIPANSSCVTNQLSLSANLSVKNVTIDTSASFSMNSGVLSVKGNWVNNGSFSAGAGTVSFDGSTPQFISGLSVTSFNNLILNNSAGLTLNSPAQVTNSLSMSSGNIFTSNLTILTLGVGSLASLNWTAGSIVGPFKRWYAGSPNSGNSSGLFPVGTATINRWALIEFSNGPTIPGYLTVEFKAINPSTSSAGLNGLTLTDQFNWQLDNISSDGYWDITPTTLSGGTYNLTLRPKSFTSIGASFDISRIIKSPNNHTSWEIDGTHGTCSGTLSDFTISRIGLSGFSYFAIAYPSSAPLPIELVSFQGNCIENSHVELTWTTASEHNSSHFELEKSRDGIFWSTIAIVSAAQESSSLIQYSYTDPLEKDLIYYRLKQVDLDGMEETFNTISVSCADLVLNSSPKSFPNPSFKDFYLEFKSDFSNDFSFLTLLDLNGQPVYNQALNIINGVNVVHLKDIDVVPGIYFIELNIGTTKYRIKHVIQ